MRRPNRVLAPAINGGRRPGWALAVAGVLLVALTAALAAVAAPDWGPLVLLDREIKPGERQKFSYSRVRSFEAAFLDTAVFASRGVRPGPTLCLTALVHGDLHPRNVLLRDNTDAVVLTDFGMAALLSPPSARARTTDEYATYRAPELAKMVAIRRRRRRSVRPRRLPSGVCRRTAGTTSASTLASTASGS